MLTCQQTEIRERAVYLTIFRYSWTVDEQINPFTIFFKLARVELSTTDIRNLEAFRIWPRPLCHELMAAKFRH